jgi:hypothetical protein
VHIEIINAINESTDGMKKIDDEEIGNYEKKVLILHSKGITLYEIQRKNY